jgi:S1-C subfamily serine protease
MDRSSSPSSASDTTRAALARQAGEAVLAIEAGRMRCAALAWRPDLVVAPAECLLGVEEFQVKGELGRDTGQLVAVDPSIDVALVRCARVWSNEIRATFDIPAVGEAVALLSREGLDLTIDWRSIRKAGGAWRSRQGARIDHRIEIAAGSMPTQQGSAIVAEDGRALGMAVYGPRHLILGIPAATIEGAVAEYIAHGRLRRGYLGISVLPLPLTDDVAARWHVKARGVLIVAGVAADSPAGRAGIDVGDLLLSGNGEPLTRPEVLTAQVRDRAPGQTLKLVRRRGPAIDEVDVPLGERPVH